MKARRELLTYPEVDLAIFRFDLPSTSRRICTESSWTTRTFFGPSSLSTSLSLALAETNTSTMKTFQIVTLFALIAASMAFAPNQVSQGEISEAWG